MSDTLSEKEIQQFILDGFVRIDNAFSQALANAAVDILWSDLPCERANRATWAEPVIRLGMYSQPPFVESVNSEKLHAAFDQLVGKGQWIPCRSVGTFPVRFPASHLPPEAFVDTGRHVDASFPGSNPDNFLEWRINVKSKGRALLMLVLYSDVGENDAPTVVYKGSHADVAGLLRNEGDAGLSFMELAGRLGGLPEREAALATGKAGTVYLCHPLLVHAAQPHRGATPRFMAQPPLLPKGELLAGGAADSPVMQAIGMALG